MTPGAHAVGGGANAHPWAFLLVEALIDSLERRGSDLIGPEVVFTSGPPLAPSVQVPPTREPVDAGNTPALCELSALPELAARESPGRSTGANEEARDAVGRHRGLEARDLRLQAARLQMRGLPRGEGAPAGEVSSAPPIEDPPTARRSTNAATATARVGSAAQGSSGAADALSGVGL